MGSQLKIKNMEKQEYKNRVEEQKSIIKTANERIADLRTQFIENNKPCNKGDNIEIVLNSGRKVKGEAYDFGILHDKNVHVISYKSNSKTKYISVPNQSVTVL